MGLVGIQYALLQRKTLFYCRALKLHGECLSEKLMRLNGTTQSEEAMTDDLKKRLNTMGATGWNPIGYEALERINQLEAERDQLREHVKMLRDELNTVYKLVPDLVVLMEPSALAATEPKE